MRKSDLSNADIKKAIVELCARISERTSVETSMRMLAKDVEMDYDSFLNLGRTKGPNRELIWAVGLKYPELYEMLGLDKQVNTEIIRDYEEMKNDVRDIKDMLQKVLSGR